jgi:protein-S-isoprenylcysteine O-methyltransferase Ste14
MWLSKPIYEALPYFYLLVGAVTLSASMYLNHWYWPSICFTIGLLSLVAGLVVLLKRRDYRSEDGRLNQEQEY